MGSSFSVYNDTDQTVYIQQGANWDAILPAVVGSAAAVSAIATGGIGLASAGALARVLKIPKEKADEIAREINTFRDEAEVIGPGETFRYDSTLSMTRTVYVMNENGEVADGTAWTGPTDGSDIW